MVTEAMFGRQNRIDEAEPARASWGDPSETRQPRRRDSRAIGRVCSWTEKIRIKSLETVGVVRDNAVTGKMRKVGYLSISGRSRDVADGSRSEHTEQRKARPVL
jgi:hypothetical protein